MSSRTEQPTPRRLRRARLQGDVAVSRDLTSASALLAGTLALAAMAPSLTHGLAGTLHETLWRAVQGGIEPWPALVQALTLFARCALAPVSAAVAAAALAGSLQAKGLITLEPLRFRLDRLDPFRGLLRLISTERLVSVVLGLLKAAILLLAGWRTLRRASIDTVTSPRLDARAALRLLASSTLDAMLLLAGIALAFGILDHALARRRHRKALMMTRDEVRREHREDEGDPRHRSERRRLHRALASAAPLTRAACVVVNPTHFAVALEHGPGSEDAPIVLAKATSHAALQLRREARRLGIPVVRDVALARALFRLAEVGEEIPVELYDAAAAVLVHVHGSAGEVAP